MNLDLPHTIVTALLIFVTLVMIRRTSLYQSSSRLKRALVFGGALFVVLLILNLIWPYGESPVFLAG
jgi:hypothetical protein